MPRHIMQRWLATVVALLVPVSRLPAASTNATEGDKVRILLIGNSYTAGTRAALNLLLKDSKAEATYITPGGCTLEKHLGNAATTDVVRTIKWDVVVLQEQSQMPSLPGEFRESFDAGAAKLAALVKASGARPVLYMTWGRRDGDKKNPEVNPDYATMQDRLSEGYRTAGAANGMLVAPVGEAWRRAWAADATLGAALYKKDGSHPSAKGAYLSACVLHAVIFGGDAMALPQGKGVTAEEAALLRKCAQEAVAAERARQAH